MKSTLRQPPTHTIKIPAQALRTFTLQLEVIGAPWTNVLYDESNFAQDATGQVQLVAESHIFRDAQPWIALYILATPNVLKASRHLYP